MAFIKDDLAAKKVVLNTKFLFLYTCTAVAVDFQSKKSTRGLFCEIAVLESVVKILSS